MKTQPSKRELAAALLNSKGFRHLRSATRTRPLLTAADFNGEGRSKVFQRSAEVGAIDVDARTVELAFSSEIEVERWYGIEILSHDIGACDLSRLNDGGALLMDHSTRDQVGVVVRAEISADRRGRAVVRFGRSTRANEVFQDVVDGIRKHVSVGYEVQAWALTEERENNVDVYTVTSWLPMEISFVAIPADASVGVGRSADLSPETVPETPAPTREVAAPVVAAKQPLQVRQQMDPEVLAAQQAATKTALEAERARVAALNALGEQYGAHETARQFVGSGGTIQEMQAALLARQHTPAPAGGLTLNLSQQETRAFSIVRAVKAMSNPTDREAARAAAFEFEVSEAAAKRDGKSVKGFYVPPEVLVQRDANAGALSKTGSGSTGSNVVATELLASSFIEEFHNSSILIQKATRLSGLTSDVEIPRQIARQMGYWVGEGIDATIGRPGFDKLHLSPKDVAARTQLTRRMLQQPALSMEALVRKDLALALALAIDLKGYYGDGTLNTPIGIANTPGLQTLTFAGANPTYAELVEMETMVAAANAEVGTLEYLAHSNTRGALKVTQMFPGTANGVPVWNGNEVNGRSASISNQINSGDVFYGRFDEMLAAFWGGLDIVADQFTDSASGSLNITAFQSCDIGARHGVSFVLGKAHS